MPDAVIITDIEGYCLRRKSESGENTVTVINKDLKQDEPRQ